MVWKHIKAGQSSVLDVYCCVRTIVVWKLEQVGVVHLLLLVFWLRKNHSGMETWMPRVQLYLARRLRKNHSGMETCIVTPQYFSPFASCVRTIVVWKRD